MSALETQTERQWLELSLAQRAVWLDASLSDDPTAYTLVRVVRMKGAFDPEAARQALTLVTARHDALRLRADSELPRQWLHGSSEAAFTLVDLSAEPDPERAARARIARTLATPLPLGDRSLFALELLALAPREWRAVIRCHHLLADEAGLSMILHHWLSAYRALTSDGPAELAPPSSYVAEIAADVAYAESERYRADLDYWTGRFKSLSPQLLQPQGASATAPSRAPHVVKWTVEGALFERFSAAAKKAGVTPQRALIASLAIVLSRRYGPADVTLGLALHRRTASNAHVVGMLAGAIAVRCRLSGIATFRETARELSAQIDRDLRHQRLPVDALARELGISQSGLAGLFQVAFSYLPFVGALDIALDDLTFEVEHLPSSEASPLTLHAYELEGGRGLLLDVAAHPGFIDEAEARRIASLLQAALVRFVEEPDAELERFAGTTEAERLEVVTTRNATAAAFPQGTADHFFDRSAQAAPGAPAVVSETEALGYAELDARSNQLARRLLARGLAPQTVVGVALERSVSTVVSLLAILKAGCVYLPLDVAYPPERLAYMLADSGAALAIADAATAARLPAQLERILIDAPETFAGESGALPGRSHTPADPAYIIYTSGSTGKPKGVAVPHAAAVNLAFARLAHDPIGAGDRILAAISVGFDVSIGQLLLPLLSGATVVVAGDLRSLGAREFWDFLGAQRVTHVNSVPSFFESVLDAAPASPSLVRLMLGGEPLASALARRLREALPHTDVYNMYGPTEACIDATCYRVTGLEGEAVLPIGRPLPNYRAYVLDARLEPAGIGVAGDLFLAGAGLAQAYVNAPALTAERFIADPFGAPGERLYRTGDRARRRADGSLEFLGRADMQVKIRGHRVELGEIEAALRAHPFIAAAAVVAGESPAGPARLVAYCVPRAAGSSLDGASLRAHLAGRLPEYMLPAAFVTIAALPLTPNGKLDQQALPAVDWQAARAHVAPRGESELRVAALFAELLEIERAGASDHFFELGGHSLLATRLVSALRSRFGVAVPLRAVFEAPTVAALARYLDGAAGGATRAFVALPRPERLPLSFTQERLWFLSALLGDATYNVPFAVRIGGALESARAVRVLEQIVARHEALRTCIVMHEGRPGQEIRPPASFAVRTLDLSGASGAQQAGALAERLNALAQARFDLSADLPVKIELIALGPGSHVLAGVAHHASFDGWSAKVFFEEFARLYAAGAEPRAVQPLALHFADFALWQREADFSREIAFWRERLAGAPPVLEFPADRPPAGGRRLPAGVVPIALDEALGAALLEVANAAGASLFMLLHAAFASMLARWSGQTDLVVGTVTANRPYAEFEPVIGCFVNTLALRTRVPPLATFAQLLAATREDDLAAFEHQAVPFERLVEVLQPERALDQTPLFQAMLVLQNEAPRASDFAGLKVEPLALEPGPAKFNLTLNLAAPPSGAGLSGAFEYDAGRYDAATIERFSGQFVRLLRAVAADPQTVPLRAGLFDRGERAVLGAASRGVERAFPRGTADELFEQRARENPGALAVTGAAESLSYAELDARAGRLARRLAAHGLPAQSVVGVALERSVASVVSLLAILKAGHVYLPLDPAYPPGRLAHMLSDSGAKLAVSDTSLAAALPAGVARLLLDVPQGDDDVAAAAPPRRHGPDDLAYIVYTSGSSGTPKGVAVPHAAAVNLAFARLEHDPISAGDRILAAVSVGFDVSIGQLLLPLLSGAAIVVAGDLRSLSASEFWDFLEAQRVTHVNSVPSFFESVLPAAPAQSSLVRLMLGGEALGSALAARLRRALPHAQLFNMYGPTEACIDATCYAVSGLETEALLPIGRPLPNYRAYVLNALLEPAGIGIAGELYLAGPGLAQAYVGAPALTAERFVADPFGAPGSRMYETGDRARVRPDGQIEFLGRADTQVKIRGQRVELGEIEAQLARQSGVREVAVTVREDVPGDRRLVAYYTAAQPLQAAALREALGAALPAHMIPAAYVRLEALPLTTNGKLNREALPAPGAGAYGPRAFEPPQGESEELIAGIFAEALGLERVGRRDNFFELGGHSLLVMSVIERLAQAGRRVDVRALFAAPTVAGLAAAARDASGGVAVPPNRIGRDATQLSPEMLPLVQLTQAEIDAILARVPGGLANVADIYPLAPLQEGILFHHVTSRQGDAYLTPFVLGFDRRGRLERFLDALREIVARHDILRTAILWEGLSEPVQVVLREARLGVEEVTLDGASPAGAVEQLRERYDPRHHRIDVRRAPLLHAFVARDPAADRWLLLLLSHHLILDHSSLETILHEVELISSGRRSELPEPQPFRDFVAQARLGTPPQEHEAFFRRMLGDVDEPTAPYGLRHVEGDGSGIRESSLGLEASLARRLRERARALGVGPATIFHLAWALVLGHVSGRRDVVFGTLLFGRMHSGANAARTLGMFINTLPMRIKLDGCGVERAVLRTHEQLAGLLRHERASLALAQRCSGVPAPAPLFSALFNFRHSPAAADGSARAWPGVELLFAQERTDYPVALAVDDRTNDFLLTAQADAPVEPADLCRYLETALDNLVGALESAPLAPLRSVSVLPREEYAKAVHGCNRTEALFPAGTLHGLFEEQAARTPEAVAVTDGTNSLTYAELDVRAERLADLLAASGCERHSVVGVALPRSLETVVALLAILKAGGVYLPLDPAYPPERLRYALADSHAGLAVVNGETEALVAPAVTCLRVDAPQAAPERRPAGAVPGDVAYVIYTSGSTGKPKGVAVPHSAAVNLAFARRAHDPIGPGDRILAAISVGFDVSIGQLLLPLLAGSTVVIAGDLRSLSAREFWDFLQTQRVTHVNSVPSFFESVLEAVPASSPLVRLMLGGEALSGALLCRLRAALPGTQVFNMYGPTEACIDATCWPAAAPDDAAALPIGKPLPNYRAYILDALLEPAGTGVEGDLYLAGAGLAHAYAGQPALTAERFTADPFGAPGTRMYKTGDRARRRSDGNIEFLGRADQQVKIRGHRIELGEIEAQLTAFAGVREAVAVVREDVPGERRLVAYYTAGEPLAADALRASLASALPEYMLPAACVRLASLPLSPNGKLDRKALPAPDAAAYATRRFEPPAGPLEERLAALFAEVLHAASVGRHDNFFELGGHSLLAMSLIERMRAAGLAVDVRTLFSAPTVAGLASAAFDAAESVAVPPNRIPPGAQRITPEMLSLLDLQQAEIDAAVAGVPGGAANVADIYPLAPLQEGILFRHLMSDEGDAYLTPFLVAFERRAQLDAFLAALREMIARHDILRTAIVWEKLSEPVQVVLREADLPVEEVTLEGDPEDDAADRLRARFDPRRYRIDIRRAPMLHAFAAEDATKKRWLLMVVSHHLILDHTSLEVILKEIGLIARGRRDALPAATPFRNFIARTRLAVPPEEHEAFFGVLLGEVDEPTLPFGLTQVSGDGSGIRESRRALGGALTRRLRERARALGVSPATLFHLAWALVLAHAAGRSDVVFGTLLFGRMRGGDGAQRTLGMFINTLPVRVRLAGTSVEAAVLGMHLLLAQLLRHEHASLALAQRCSGVPAPAPLFSALFNFRHSEPGEMTGEGGGAWPGVELLFAQERTDYPLALAVDDRSTDFLITAQADAPVDPVRVCAYMETAVINLVAALETQPQAALQSCSVLPPAEYRQVTADCGGPQIAYASGTLDGLVAAQAARTPQAIAVTGDGLSLTYAELDARAEALAGALASRGAGRQSVVGVALPRSVSTVVSLLAVLKLGAAYLPLDPAYPPERLRFMLGDSGASHVVTDGAGAALVPAGLAFVDVASAAPPVARKRPEHGPGDVAYVIYTSGSTGKPKGVAVPHRAAVNLAFARLAHDPIASGDRVLAAVSVGFDVSIGQLLLPLLSGATVVIAGELRAMDGRRFWEFVETERVTHANSVPSFFESILSAAPPSTSLVRLMLGGEPLASALVRRLREALPRTQIFNMYGPTEACIDATCYEATGSETEAVLPIGKPLPNYRAYVLDARLEPAGIGVAGDLYLGGAGLAHAYLNAPALTAERFVADPFGPPGERLYKTGDRARRRADGSLEFLGRADTQVKIHGHRIELGEIEAALLEHPAVSAAAVLARAQRRGPARLGAYLVSDPAAPPPGDGELRAHLAARLPEYMIPSAFRVLPALPLTLNGKLDHKALPDLGAERAGGAAFEPPQSPYEIAMARIWQRVLGVEAVGRHDAFFALGGNSLAAIRLVTAVNAHFDARLPLRALFEHPTVAQLCRELAAPGEASLHPALVPLRAAGERPPLFCIHPAGGHVFCYAPLAAALPAGQPVYGLQARALEADRPLAASIEEMAADYLEAVRSIQPAGPYRLLGMSSGGLVAYEMARRSRECGERVAFLALLDTSNPAGQNEHFGEPQLMRGLAAEFGAADLFAERAGPASVGELLERAWEAGRLPREVDAATVERIAAVYRNTVRLCAAYRPQAWPGPLLFLRALVRDRSGDEPPDWSAYAGPGWSFVDLTCTHADLMSQAMAARVAAQIEPFLDGGA